MAEPLNPLFRRDNVMLRKVAEQIENGQTVAMVMPFTFYLSKDEEWLLPYEPLISVQGENIIIKRNVAKFEGRGSIKERWTEGDIKVIIEGMFVNADPTKYPTTEVQKLRRVITQRREIKIKNELLSLLNVNYLVIENYNLPFSKGENVQNYSLTALSDDSYNLFIKEK